MLTYARSKIQPNDYETYIDAKTGALLHVSEFFNEYRSDRRPAPASLIAYATRLPDFPPDQ
jgi:hypothetical protein